MTAVLSRSGLRKSATIPEYLISPCAPYLSRTDLRYPTISLVFFLSSTLGSISCSCRPWYCKSHSSDRSPTSAGRRVIFVLLTCSEPSFERTPTSLGNLHSSLLLKFKDCKLGNRMPWVRVFAGDVSAVEATDAGRFRGSTK